MTANISFTGNATSDAELKFLPSGVAVANVTVAVTPREKVGDQWQDGQPAFYRVAVWRDMAENVAESVKRGDRVTVVGKLKPREWEKDGAKRLSLEVEADSVALDLRFRSAQSAPKAARGAGGGFSQPQAAQSDPWATQPERIGSDGLRTGGQGGWPTDEPPF